MFSKNKQVATGQTAAKPARPSIPSIISVDLTVNGNLVSEGEIQIDGTINGDVNTATLLVGESAKIHGDIKAQHVRVHGHVNGQITAKSVTLAETAHVVGDVIHEDLSIEKGAFLEGHCKRIDEHKAETEKTSAKADGVKDIHPPIPQKPSQHGRVESIQKPAANAETTVSGGGGNGKNATA